MITKPILVIMRGLPGSGKSTLAESLENTQTVICSADSFFMKDGKYNFDAAQLGAAHEMCKLSVRYSLKMGFNVIVDNTNTTYSEVETYLKIAKEFGVTYELMEPNTYWKDDVDECFKRNSHNVPYESIKKMKNRYMSNEEIIKKWKENN